MRHIGQVLLLMTLAWNAAAADLNKGYTFTAGEKNVTHTKLNNLVDQASINTSFYTDKSATTAPVATDLLLLYSTANAAYRKVSVNSLVLGNTQLITEQTEDTTPALGDFVLTYDASAAGYKKARLESLIFTNANLIAERTADETPAVDASLLILDGTDYFKVARTNLFFDGATYMFFTNLAQVTAPNNLDALWIWDASETANRQITLSNLVNGAAAATTVTDGDYLWGYSTNDSAIVKYTAGQLKTLTTNGIMPITFVSNQANVVAGTAINVTHGLPGTPQSVRAVMVCTTADSGYAIGDEVAAEGFNIASGPPGIASAANAANVFCVVRSTTLGIGNKSTGAPETITTASWRLKIYATYFP